MKSDCVCPWKTERNLHRYTVTPELCSQSTTFGLHVFTTFQSRQNSQSPTGALPKPKLNITYWIVVDGGKAWCIKLVSHTRQYSPKKKRAKCPQQILNISDFSKFSESFQNRPK